MHGELRWLDVELAELRAETDDQGPRLEGYAARFGVLSTGLRMFRERVMPGAFKRSIERQGNDGIDIAALWNHNPDWVMGRRSAKTLDLAEDDRGLRVVIRPPTTQVADHWVELVRRGDVRGMSFAFNVRRPDGERWLPAQRAGEPPIRELVDVELVEVSPATWPIYPGTRIAARAVVAAAEARGVKVDPALCDPSLPDDQAEARFAPVLEALLNGGEPVSDAGGEDARRAAQIAAHRRRLDLLGL